MIPEVKPRLENAVKALEEACNALDTLSYFAQHTSFSDDVYNSIFIVNQQKEELQAHLNSMS